MVYSRRAYGVIDLLSDFGGIYEIVIISFSLVFLPLAEHSFLMKALRLFYKVKTHDPNIFGKTSSKKAKIYRAVKRKLTAKE